MTIKKVGQAALSAWVEGLIEQGTVIGVQARADKFDFAPLSKASDLRLDYDVSLTPPGKVALLPPREAILRYEGGRYQSVVADEPFVLLGVHPYDAVAIAQMDKIFSQENNDVHYQARREAATIVACDVENASKNVFAGWLGYAVCDSGFDVLLTRIADGQYLADARTEKGLKIMGGLASAPAADKKSLAAREQVWRRNKELLRKHELKVKPEDLPELLERSYDHPVWEEKARLCFSCGSCITLCPTCYCFDVQEDLDWDMQGATRTRTWNGCMLASFAVVAGGHNFRADKTGRYRHRYYRKGKWVAEKVGQIACVGCGRCITACVSKIAHPPEVYNRLLEVK
jgi:sulfhydrogenase subunit beta (sulfur reductase)